MCLMLAAELGSASVTRRHWLWRREGVIELGIGTVEARRGNGAVAVEAPGLKGLSIEIEFWHLEESPRRSYWWKFSPIAAGNPGILEMLIIRWPTGTVMTVNWSQHIQKITQSTVRLKDCFFRGPWDTTVRYSTRDCVPNKLIHTWFKSTKS